MLFNLIGFVSIIVLLIPAMIYIYQWMFTSKSIAHHKGYKTRSNSSRRTTPNQQRRQQRPSPSVKTKPQTQKKVINDNVTFSVKNISNPYDLYK